MLSNTVVWPFSAGFDTFTTQQLATALLERAQFTNGLDFISADVALALYEALDMALTIQPDNEPNHEPQAYR